jgi:asparagine synthetase B (glutamine-hydrolysing)
MLGLYGVIDLAGRDRGERLAALAEAMADRLTGIQERSGLKRSGWFAIGRAGGAHHHNVRWAIDPAEPAVAGILQNPVLDGNPFAHVDAAALRGFFAACLPMADGSISIVADRRASVPLFYAECGGLLLFSPEVKGLLAGGLPRDLDEAAFASFLASGHLIGAQTLFRSVRRLRGGEKLQVTPSGGVCLERYWHFRPGSRAESGSEEDLTSALLEEMEKAVARNLERPERSFIFLSGGADSRGVFGAALKALPAERITAVTWTRDRGGRRSDLDVAAKLAERAKVRHLVLISRPKGFPEHFARSNAMIDCLTDSAPAHPYFRLIGEELIAQGLQTGLRGDEVFGWWHPVSSFAEAMAAVGLRSLDEAGVAKAVRSERLVAIRNAQDEALSAIAREVEGLTPQQAKDCIYFDHRLQTYLGTQNRLLTASLDHRNPLLDESLLDFMERVPDPLRAHKLLYQRVLANRYGDLWKLGIAGRSARPDWASLIELDPHLLPYIDDALADASSGIWDYLSREHMLAVLDRLKRREPVRRLGWKPVALSIYRRLRPSLPSALINLAKRSRSRTSPVAPAIQLWRMLALKHWYDVLRLA